MIGLFVSFGVSFPGLRLYVPPVEAPDTSSRVVSNVVFTRVAQFAPGFVCVNRSAHNAHTQHSSQLTHNTDTTFPRTTSPVTARHHGFRRYGTHLDTLHRWSRLLLGASSERRNEQRCFECAYRFVPPRPRRGVLDTDGVHGHLTGACPLARRVSAHHRRVVGPVFRDDSIVTERTVPAGTARDAPHGALVVIFGNERSRERPTVRDTQAFPPGWREKVPRGYRKAEYSGQEATYPAVVE